MKKIILLSLMFFLSACGVFSQNNANNENNSPLANNESTSVEMQSENPSNSDYDNVFEEEVMGENDYPSTSLPDAIPIGELREAINGYYEEILPAEEKEANFEPIEDEVLEELQQSLDNNDILSELNAQVDQIQMTIGEDTNYVLRIVVEMPFEEAHQIQENNDILLLNEALAHAGNRLVLLTYYDEENDTLTPYHLNNRTSSLFSISD